MITLFGLECVSSTLLQIPVEFTKLHSVTSQKIELFIPESHSNLSNVYN
jgi:hypothetical protein